MIYRIEAPYEVPIWTLLQCFSNTLLLYFGTSYLHWHSFNVSFPFLSIFLSWLQSKKQNDLFSQQPFFIKASTRWSKGKQTLRFSICLCNTALAGNKSSSISIPDLSLVHCFSFCYIHCFILWNSRTRYFFSFFCFFVVPHHSLIGLTFVSFSFLSYFLASWSYFRTSPSASPESFISVSVGTIYPFHNFLLHLC